MKPIDFNSLIHSVTYWLCFQDRVGRGFMVQESSLKYPVADYLTGIGIPLELVKLEFSHPQLKKRRIDLITTDKVTTVRNYKIMNAMEFKLVKPETAGPGEKQRIFNDLMRMHLMALHKKSTSYFMICGKHGDYLNYFRNISGKPPKNKRQDIPDDPEGFYKEWFGFKRNEVKTFNVDVPFNKEYDGIYAKFLKEYEEKKGQPKLALPKTITTKCIAFSSLIKDTPTPYVGGIWEVRI